jgi:hypothetical protein
MCTKTKNRLSVNGVWPTAAPHNNYEELFKTIMLAITGYQVVYGHEISKQESRHTGECWYPANN